MRLNDCTPGDLVAIIWPHGSDYSTGEYGDVALRGTEQIVQYAGPSGKPLTKKGNAPIARVTLCNYETHRPISRAFCFIEDVEILDIVERSRYMKVSSRTENALGNEGDVNDPMQGR